MERAHLFLSRFAQMKSRERYFLCSRSHIVPAPVLIAEDGVDLRRISEISGAISQLIN